MIDWNFSIGWFFIGVLILTAGALVVVFYRQISENLAYGVASYDKVKIIGLITAGIGLLVMANLHTLLLSAFVNLVFNR